MMFDDGDWPSPLSPAEKRARCANINITNCSLHTASSLKEIDFAQQTRTLATTDFRISQKFDQRIQQKHSTKFFLTKVALLCRSGEARMQSMHLLNLPQILQRFEISTQK